MTQSFNFYAVSFITDTNKCKKMLPGKNYVHNRQNTSLHGPLSQHSYTAVLEVNRKEPSPFQFEAASLHIVWISNRL